MSDEEHDGVEGHSFEYVESRHTYECDCGWAFPAEDLEQYADDGDHPMDWEKSRIDYAETATESGENE